MDSFCRTKTACSKIIVFFLFVNFQNSFLFSLVWSIGASVDTDSRPKFDSFLRELLTGKDEKHPIPSSIGKVDNAFPTDGLVYDFLFEVNIKAKLFDSCQRAVAFLAAPGYVQ